MGEPRCFAPPSQLRKKSRSLSCLLRPGLSTSPRRAWVRQIKFSRNFDQRVFVLEPLVGANSTFRLNYQRSIVSHLGRGAATYMPSSSQSFWGINMLPTRPGCQERKELEFTNVYLRCEPTHINSYREGRLSFYPKHYCNLDSPRTRGKSNRAALFPESLPPFLSPSHHHARNGARGTNGRFIRLARTHTRWVKNSWKLNMQSYYE